MYILKREPPLGGLGFSEPCDVVLGQAHDLLVHQRQAQGGECLAYEAELAEHALRSCGVDRRGQPEAREQGYELGQLRGVWSRPAAPLR